MKNIISLAIFFAFSNVAIAQNVDIPDPYFLNFLIEEGFDLNGDAIKAFEQEFEPPKSIGISWSKKNNTIQIHCFKTDFDRTHKTLQQFEHQNYRTLHYQTEDSTIDEEFNMWSSIRQMTKERFLPTVLLYYVDRDLYDFPIHTDTEIFGRAVIKNLRDETMSYHSQVMEIYKDKSEQQMISTFRESWSDEFKSSKTKEAKFFCSLDEAQRTYLNDYVLKMIDNIGFNLMRSLDESSFRKDCKGISVLVNGTRAEDLDMMGNGNLSGEYLDWIERFSQFKEFQG